jgi:DnaJ family protein A protein 2
MPSPRHHDMGDMYVSFSVKFPEKNWTQDPAAFEALRQVLPSPALEAVPPADAMTEPVGLEDVDNSRSRSNFGGGAGMEDDDDDGHPGAERVQCASQ